MAGSVFSFVSAEAAIFFILVFASKVIVKSKSPLNFIEEATEPSVLYDLYIVPVLQQQSCYFLIRLGQTTHN